VKRPAWIFIHLFLVVQLALPIWYYAGRRDKNDERFAWRMFSPTRMIKCTREFYVGPSPQPISNLSEFHEAWDTVAARGRRVVIEHMAQHLCDKNPDKEVRVKSVCTGIDGKQETLSAGVWNFCELGNL
jgi:hypothetical protein